MAAGIQALDKPTANATAQRKEENNAGYKALNASSAAAVQVVAFANNRLNKFYNLKLCRPAGCKEVAGHTDSDTTTPSMEKTSKLIVESCEEGLAEG